VRRVSPASAASIGATARRRAGRGALARHLPVLAALTVFGGHGALFGGWLIDDAGISFVYARKPVTGHGLVSQPGLAPVEGYSNFLWVLLVAPLYAGKVFVLPWTAKALGAGLVALAYLVCWRAVAAATPSRALRPGPEVAMQERDAEKVPRPDGQDGCAQGRDSRARVRARGDGGSQGLDGRRDPPYTHGMTQVTRTAECARRHGGRGPASLEWTSG
jgi:hypothetical protein